MPWNPEDAKKHDKQASGGKAARQWAHIANSALARGDSEGAAIRKASGVVGRSHSAPASAMGALKKLRANK